MYGFWGSLGFFMTFAYFLHLGSLETMTKEVPKLLRLGKKEEAHEMAQIAFTFYLMMISLVCIALWVYAFSLSEETPIYIRWGCFAGSIALACEVLLDFQQVFARTEQRFHDISIGLLIANGISLILTFWLVRGFGIYGQLIVAVATPLIGLCYLLYRVGGSWKFTWSIPKLIAMIRGGFSILIMTMVFAAVWWTDRALVLHFSGSEGFGLYMIGIMATQICFIFPEVLASVIEPRIHYDYTVSHDPSHLREHLQFPLQILAYIMPLGLGFLDLALPIFVKHFLPQYIPGIFSMRILIWGSLMMGFSVCTKAFMVATGNQKKSLWIYASAIPVNVSIGIFLAHHGWGLAGIATGTLASYFICSIALLTFSYHELGDSFSKCTRQIAKFFFPAACVILLMTLIPELLRNSVDSGTLLGYRCLALTLYGGIVYFQISRQIGFKSLLTQLQKKPHAIVEPIFEEVLV
jgi:O-antigen/teichoic acid export membrane protein